MSTESSPLTVESTVGEWLDHPVGGLVLRGLLAEGGQTADSLGPARSLAIGRLVELSQGKFPAAMIDELIRRVDAGEIPEGIELPPVDESLPAPVARPRWSERVDQGRFTGQTIIITGAGSGIGRATASRVAREGGRVIAVDISQERLDEFAAAHPSAEIVTVVGDITSDDAVAAIITAAGDRIDGLANIAGIMDNMTPVGDVTDAVWDRVFAINVTGTMKLSRAVIPAMLAQGKGSIVNTASEAALRGSAAGAAYTASKHAVAGLTKSTAFMYGPSGIRTNAVAPGPTITNIEARFDSPLGAQRVQKAMTILPDPVEADALAASITFLLSDDGVNVNGVILPSDGGWSVA